MTPVSTPERSGSEVEKIIAEQREALAGITLVEQDELSSAELAEIDRKIKQAQRSFTQAQSELAQQDEPEQERLRLIEAMRARRNEAQQELRELEAARERAEREARERALKAELQAWHEANPADGLIEHSMAFAINAEAEKQDKYYWLKREVKAVLGIDAPPRHLWRTTNADTVWNITLYGLLDIQVVLHADGAGFNILPLWPQVNGTPEADFPRPLVLIPGQYEKLGNLLRSNPAIAARLRGGEADAR